MVGRRLLNYKIERKIDEGGMGTIYEGVHMHLGRRVAIKMLNPLLREKPDVKERFKNEAKTLSKLNHPNIVALYDYIENDDGIFLILEYVEGKPLDEYIDLISGPIPEARATKLFIKMLDAVAYIHSKNIIHRDIKPSNFIVTPDFDIKLLDFGIAKILGEPDKKLTKDGTKVGTALYMSPQQVKGQVLDRRTDIYSLGITFFQMLTGQYPYDTNLSEYEIYNKIIYEPLPELKDYYVGVSEKMQEIIFKATAKRPLDRFQSCEEFSAALLELHGNKQNPSLSLKTKILDINENEISQAILNQTFWKNFALLLLTAILVGAIAVSIYSVRKQKTQYIIGYNVYLYSGDSLTAEWIEDLSYGQSVKVIANSFRNQNGIEWTQVSTLQGNTGFVLSEYLVDAKVFDQINAIFANDYARKLTPIKYKHIVRKYFIENRFFDKVTPDWRIIAETDKEIQLNEIARGDWNDNSIMDYACILSNSKNSKSKMLVFFDNTIENISIDFEQLVKIRRIKKGRAGGNWFIGNKYKKTYKSGKTYEIPKYEHLPYDGIFIYKTQTAENFVFIFNKEENMPAFYQQPE